MRTMDIFLHSSRKPRLNMGHLDILKLVLSLETELNTYCFLLLPVSYHEPFVSALLQKRTMRNYTTAVW